MVQPQVSPQPPIVSGTKTMADIQRNERTAAHAREDERAARSRTTGRSAGGGILARLRRLLGR
jgi:hypothetical protein